MIAEDEAFVRSMRRIVDNHDGPADIRMPRSVLERLVVIAERGVDHNECAMWEY